MASDTLGPRPASSRSIAQPATSGGSTWCRRRLRGCTRSPSTRCPRGVPARSAPEVARTLRDGPRNLIDLAPPAERAFLIAVDTGDDPGWTAEESLAELASLAVTAGAEVVGAEWQNRRHVDPNWYLGKGKAEELVAAKSETGFNLLVADDEL